MRTLLLRLAGVASTIVCLPLLACDLEKRMVFNVAEFHHLRNVIRSATGQATAFCFHFFEMQGNYVLLPLAFVLRPYGIFVFLGVELLLLSTVNASLICVSDPAINWVHKWQASMRMCNNKLCKHIILFIVLVLAVIVCLPTLAPFLMLNLMWVPQQMLGLESQSLQENHLCGLAVIGWRCVVWTRPLSWIFAWAIILVQAHKRPLLRDQLTDPIVLCILAMAAFGSVAYGCAAIRRWLQGRWTTADQFEQSQSSYHQLQPVVAQA
eukprot:gnl/TRDRNA2_/TRDRNA2_63545_c0_seq2.p1 gnl/TRDRNA2_/TRDRNA2_63545_c0~~gnl/TRDRNA2_/TRDRNA2_63545_c0_seq2.p1  ORF type:complete len:278 (-),score=24.21 gnl/TRDRNA2_/TRDRNA2_63545_c0_seq2:8-805(-)